MPCGFVSSSLVYPSAWECEMCLLAEFGDKAFWEVIVTSVIFYFVFFYWGDPCGN